ncbi:MAG: hypothetical protein ACI3ZD_03550 [Prevotella sp.]
MSDIRMVTSMKAIDELFAKAAKIIYKCVVNYLAELGEKCKNRIRDRPGAESWYDKSGNLRSSIGYAIYSYGMKQIESAFNAVLGGSEGSQKGRQMVADLASKYSDTYALVVVAAMEYADYVESIDSKDVLASTEIYAKSQVNRYMEKAIKEAEKEIQRLEVTL